MKWYYGNDIIKRGLPSKTINSFKERTFVHSFWEVNMNNKELLNQLTNLTKKEVSLSVLCEALQLNEYEVLALIRQLRLDGINILTQIRDDDIYMFNHGERE